MTKKLKKFYIIITCILISGLTGTAVYNTFLSKNDRDKIISNLHENYYYLNLYKNVSYTGDGECKSCHLEIHDSFHQNGMGRSLYRPSPSNEIEEFSEDNIVYHEKSDYYYKMYKKGDEYFQKEFRKDKDGNVIHELERKVEYIIGSGNNTRSYLFSENGFFYQMPLSWFSERSKWDMSPGYEKLNLRFSRSIVEECMNCHNSNSGFVEFSENKFDVHLKEGISCESCHGPGELHVRRQTEESDLFENIEADTTDRTIVNPADLPLDEKLSVCFQCHLQGDVRVFTEDFKQTDYRPGMKLGDVKTVFVQDNISEGDFKIASHAARMVLSKCFVKSDGGMTCITCHDPHVPVKSISNDFFNAKCLTCHNIQTLSPSGTNTDHTENSNCVSCHMRQGVTKDVQHVNFTDHWIREKIERTGEEEKAKSEDPDVSITLKNFNNAGDKYAEMNLGIAYVIYYDTKHPHQEYLKKAIPVLEENLKKYTSHKNGLYHLGLAYLRSNKYQEAINTLQNLISVDPGNAAAYFLLGSSFEKSKNYLNAMEAYEKSLEIFPENVKALNSLANLYYNSGKINEALNAYSKALNIDSDNVNVLNNIADINLYKIENTEEAKYYLLKATGIDPDFLPVLNNLGNAYLLSGDTKSAENIFNRILSKDPRNVLSLGNLAVIYKDRGDFPMSKKMISRVLAIDPNDPRAKSMLEAMNN